MAFEVSFHPETFEAFFLPVDAKHPGLSEILKTEFSRYIESDRLHIPAIFGRDAPYTQPASALLACLMHTYAFLLHVFAPGFPSETGYAGTGARVRTPHWSTFLASFTKTAF